MSISIEPFEPILRRDYYAMRDQGVSVLNAIDHLAVLHHISQRGVALMLDLAPNFVDEHFPKALGAATA